MTPVLSFTVIGVPATKGSTRSFVVTPRGGGRPRAVTTGDNPRTKGWQQNIAEGAAAALQRPEYTGLRFDLGGLELQCTFYLPRPKTLLTTRNAPLEHPHVKKPDLDKLVRACKDALTGVAWSDDSQVVHLIAGKRYCAAGAYPRVEIAIRHAVLNTPIFKTRLTK